jgi:hypothetical protein
MVLAGPAVDSPIIIPNPSPFLGDFFGNSLSVADVNGDYFLDIVEGSGRADVVSLNTGSPIVNAGEVHVLYGPLFQSWEALHSPLAVGFEARFGDIVAAYDVDGDGSAEILTTDANNWGCLVSAVAKTVVTVPKPPALLENPFGETAYGYSVGFCDANGDGLQDLLIGDAFDGSLAPCSISSTGLVYAILAPYFSTYAVVETASASCGAEFGWTTDVHDVDGDGVLDLIVGAPLSDNAGPINSGMVVIFLGG